MKINEQHQAPILREVEVDTPRINGTFAIALHADAAGGLPGEARVTTGRIDPRASDRLMAVPAIINGKPVRGNVDLKFEPLGDGFKVWVAHFWAVREDQVGDERGEVTPAMRDHLRTTAILLLTNLLQSQEGPVLRARARAHRAAHLFDIERGAEERVRRELHDRMEATEKAGQEYAAAALALEALTTSGEPIEDGVK